MVFIDFTTDQIKRIRRVMGLKTLQVKFLVRTKLFRSDSCTFRCNICGRVSTSPLSIVMNRELQSCYFCGSSKRFRSIIAALSIELYGKIIPIPNFEPTTITGIGLSDGEIYAKRLAKKFIYTNTFYHKEPKLDIAIMQTELINKADFIIASDVIEHVAPPIDRAFNNLFQMLKKGGVCIFSVPYKNSGVTEEHFPDLYDYQIMTKKRKNFLINRTQKGNVQIFDNLRFHGGPGHTLEMRVFSKASLLDEMHRAGFVDINFFDKNIPEFGIYNQKDNSSFVMSMRKCKSFISFSRNE